jgi:RNA polymerase primary sigma factor
MAKNSDISIVPYRDNISIKNYYKDVRKIEVLSGDKQVELAVKAKNGDQRSFDKLVECNLRFVISIAKEYTYSNMPLEDLISEGNIGLMEAVKRFDETKGFKFISYAVWWIRQSIMKAVCDNKSNIRLPINKINIINKMARAKDSLQQELERDPTNAEIANALDDVSEKDIKNIEKSSNFEVHIQDNIKGSEDLRYEDVLAGEGLDMLENDMNYVSLKKEIEQVLSTLSEREREILKMYYGIGGNEPMTLTEIGKKLKLTNERIRQLKTVALRRLRVFSKSSQLQDFLNCEINVNRTQ